MRVTHSHKTKDKLFQEQKEWLLRNLRNSQTKGRLDSALPIGPKKESVT